MRTGGPSLWTWASWCYILISDKQWRERGSGHDREGRSLASGQISVQVLGWEDGDGCFSVPLLLPSTSLPRLPPSRCCAGGQVQFQFSRAASNRQYECRHQWEGHQTLTSLLFFLFAIISDQVSSHLTVTFCGDGTRPQGPTLSSLWGGRL